MRATSALRFAVVVASCFMVATATAVTLARGEEENTERTFLEEQEEHNVGSTLAKRRVTTNGAYEVNVCVCACLRVSWNPVSIGCCPLSFFFCRQYLTLCTRSTSFFTLGVLFFCTTPQTDRSRVLCLFRILSQPIYNVRHCTYTCPCLSLLLVFQRF